MYIDNPPRGPWNSRRVGNYREARIAVAAAVTVAATAATAACCRCDLICGSGHGEVRNCHDREILPREDDVVDETSFVGLRFFMIYNQRRSHPRRLVRSSPRRVRGRDASFNFFGVRSSTAAKFVFGAESDILASSCERPETSLFFLLSFFLLLIINEATCFPDKCASQ